MVEEYAKQKPDKVPIEEFSALFEDAVKAFRDLPHTDENSIVTPVARLRNELRVQDRRTERQDGRHHETNVFTTVFDGNNLSGTCNKSITIPSINSEDSPAKAISSLSPAPIPENMLPA